MKIDSLSAAVKAAMEEPKAPAELVERTVALAKKMEAANLEKKAHAASQSGPSL